MLTKQNRVDWLKEDLNRIEGKLDELMRGFSDHKVCITKLEGKINEHLHDHLQDAASKREQRASLYRNIGILVTVIVAGAEFLFKYLLAR